MQKVIHTNMESMEEMTNSVAPCVNRSYRKDAYEQQRRKVNEGVGWASAAQHNTREANASTS